MFMTFPKLLYKFILEKADYNPTKPFISLVGPTALNVNTKEIAKKLEIPDSINLNEVDDIVFASTTFDILSMPLKKRAKH